MIENIRKRMESLKGRKVKITVNNMRNKKDELIGNIDELYNRVFIFKGNDNLNRSFNYSDILTGLVEIDDKKCKK